MKCITVALKNGSILTMEAGSLTYLKSVKEDYNADQKGMADAGMCLTSTFRNYVDFDKLNTFEGATEIGPTGITNAEYRFRKFRAFYPSLQD